MKELEEDRAPTTQNGDRETVPPRDARAHALVAILGLVSTQKQTDLRHRGPLAPDAKWTGPCSPLHSAQACGAAAAVDLLHGCSLLV